MYQAAHVTKHIPMRTSRSTSAALTALLFVCCAALTLTPVVATNRSADHTHVVDKRILAQACKARGGTLGNQACCSFSCSSCGGHGCDQRPDAAAECCASRILKGRRACESQGVTAPCVPTEPGAPLPFTKMAFTPQVILLGLTKAGTTTLHSCLVSGAFTNPTPYSSTGKELRFFQTHLHAMRVGNRWPGYFRSPSKLLLDFTPNYLLFGASVVDRLLDEYGTDPVHMPHFVIGLRDPIERALSHFCMFSSGRVAPCSGKGKGWDRSNQTFEMHVTSSVRAWTRGRSEMGDHQCTRPPADALVMSMGQLRFHLRACIGSAHSTTNYALSSVPVYQLALYLRTFPNATWTFYQFETLYNSSLSAQEIKERLAARFGTQLSPRLPHSPSGNSLVRDVCDFNGRGDSSQGDALSGREGAQRIQKIKMHYAHAPADDYPELRRLLMPWYDALTALVRQFVEDHPNTAVMLR